MPEEIKVNVGGTWRTITQPQINVAGVWKNCTTVEVNVGGVWKQAWPAAGTTPSVSDVVIDTVVGPTNAVTSGITFNSGGTDGRDIYKRNNFTTTLMGDDDASTPVDHTGEWTTDTVTDSEWEVACTSISSGSWGSSAAAVGTYVTLDAQRAWSISRPGGKSYSAGSAQCICVFRIREVANTSNFDDFTLTCIAEQT